MQLLENVEDFAFNGAGMGVAGLLEPFEDVFVEPPGLPPGVT